MNGDFFRLANKAHAVGDSTDASSWLRPYETRGARLYKQPEDPEAHGLSIFHSLDDLRMCRDLNPFMRKKSVARVKIEDTQGHLRHTPIEHGTSHHDWWTEPVGLVPKAEVIEPGGD